MRHFGSSWTTGSSRLHPDQQRHGRRLASHRPAMQAVCLAALGAASMMKLSTGGKALAKQATRARAGEGNIGLLAIGCVMSVPESATIAEPMVRINTSCLAPITWFVPQRQQPGTACDAAHRVCQAAHGRWCTQPAGAVMGNHSSCLGSGAACKAGTLLFPMRASLRCTRAYARRSCVSIRAHEHCAHLWASCLAALPKRYGSFLCIMTQEREVQRLRAGHHRDGPARARIMVRSGGLSLGSVSLRTRISTWEGPWTRASARYCVCAPRD